MMIVFAAVSGCATAPPQPGSEEHLRADPPSGWQPGVQTQTPRLRLSEYVLMDPNEEGWVQKLSYERLALKPVSEARTLVTGVEQEIRESCPNATFHNTFSGEENGYPTEVALWTCPRYAVTQTGQISMLKVIQGQDALYTITWAKRLPANDAGADAESTKAEVARWSAYLSAVSVCDPRRQNCDVREQPDQRD